MVVTGRVTTAPVLPGITCVPGVAVLVVAAPFETGPTGDAGGPETGVLAGVTIACGLTTSEAPWLTGGTVEVTVVFAPLGAVAPKVPGVVPVLVLTRILVLVIIFCPGTN